MDFFDKLGDSIVAAGKTVSDKAKEVSDSAKISFDIKDKESSMEDEYVELGKAYYEAHKDEEDNEFAESFKKIAAYQDDIKALKAQLQEIQGKKVCPECGEEIPADANFCAKCGAKVEE